jgi:integrase
MWQRFMTRLLKDTDVKERFTEHDLRGKVGSDETSVERASDLLGHASRETIKRYYRRKPEVIKPVR